MLCRPPSLYVGDSLHSGFVSLYHSRTHRIMPLAAPYVGGLALLVTRILDRDLSDHRLTHLVLAGGFTAGLIPSRNGEPHETGLVSSVDFGETT